MAAQRQTGSPSTPSNRGLQNQSERSPTSSSSSLTPTASPNAPAIQADDELDLDDEDGLQDWNGAGSFGMLEADSDLDIDSALGEDNDSFTTSLNSLVTNYKYENGRRYHAYQDRKYALPNDDVEINRLELQHRIWQLSMSGRLHLAPLPDTIRSALDLGCGTGTWVIEFAESHPECHVTGTDLSPIQPTMVPPNADFVVDDFTSPWLYSTRFDYIHTRMITITRNDWPRLIDQCWRGLEPGGWLEFQEFSGAFQSDDGTMEHAPAFKTWNNLIREASEKSGVDMFVMAKIDGMLRERGFVNVEGAHTKWALGPWPKGKREKEIGKLFINDILNGGLEGISLRMFVKDLGWSVEDTLALIKSCEDEIKGGRLHCYLPMEFRWAQKPHDAHD